MKNIEYENTLRRISDRECTPVWRDLLKDDMSLNFLCNFKVPETREEIRELFDVTSCFLFGSEYQTHDVMFYCAKYLAVLFDCLHINEDDNLELFKVFKGICLSGQGVCKEDLYGIKGLDEHICRYLWNRYSDNYEIVQCNIEYATKAFLFLHEYLSYYKIPKDLCAIYEVLKDFINRMGDVFAFEYSSSQICEFISTCHNYVGCYMPTISQGYYSECFFWVEHVCKCSTDKCVCREECHDWDAEYCYFNLFLKGKELRKKHIMEDRIKRENPIWI